MALSDLRRQYSKGTLSESELTPNPITLFNQWLQDTIDAKIPDPTAMTLATVSDDGQPSQRIVLLKDVTDAGFVFFTNLGSRKASELANNPKVSCHFPWFFMERQIRVCGVVEKLSLKENANYFFSRPKESQLAAFVSKQSKPISSRELLMTQFSQLKEKFANKDLPVPDFWGGFRIVPHQIEFWQGGEDRLHDRFEYNKQTDGSWTTQRLMP
ncbi:pyridoxamine 5'-phosphate oxidase [Alteromonas sp. KUL49]|uniref:pyridoxamine 5'-phosphate oxidase n=1 Tax=Alteromonas sp. KUL49 TaxID=2480798 RepID=UPI00102EF753|nr:pyridoxamine 5'-phosphate oxidase [Alteromonas sp. KUL49]TAP39870.1 pyridoxamine 5'-phosphate oxidase [Alteromonas sp. KUL49]GEA11883.1 pyridoxine/pyridoxamine 5'-phosphate oxidase [Alteromonas sp. KUL49]